jgi:hypothetical protein
MTPPSLVASYGTLPRTFEWTETAIYLALALALAGYCFGLLSRRLT